jgi:hypothetical protein
MKKVTFASKRGPSQPPKNADEWIDRASKPALPGEPMKRLTIDVPVSLHQRIKIRCAMEGFKMADVIRDMLAEKFPEIPKRE